MVRRSLPAFLFSLFTASVFSACSHGPIPTLTKSPSYYLDNELEFQPKRIWRVWVRWDPYLLDDKKALLVKEFSYVVHESSEREKLEAEIQNRGGDAAYLRWFESVVFPIGNWEERETAKISRTREFTVVVLVTKALKEVQQKSDLAIEPVRFPDVLLNTIADSCHALNWDVIPKDSVGTEVILESRDENPTAKKWTKTERDSQWMSWKAWSVGQGRRIAYRTVVFIKQPLPRCPTPPEVFGDFSKVLASQPMGVEW